MTVQLPGLTPPLGATVSIHVEVTAQVNITPFVARQRVNRFVIMEVSSQCLSDTPVLVAGERLTWLVPVLLTSPRRGVVGKVGEISVDATTGELLIDDGTAKRMTEDARALAERSPL